MPMNEKITTENRDELFRRWLARARQVLAEIERDPDGVQGIVLLHAAAGEGHVGMLGPETVILPLLVQTAAQLFGWPATVAQFAREIQAARVAEAESESPPMLLPGPTTVQ